MTAAMNTMIETMRIYWTRLMEYLEARNDSHVAAWGSALQYKRRYTNPEDAVAFRRPLQDRK